MPKKTKKNPASKYGNVVQGQPQPGILKIKYKYTSLVFGNVYLQIKNVCLTLVLTLQMTKREVRGKQ